MSQESISIMKKKRTKFNGSVLQQDVFDACYYSLRSYPFLKKVKASLAEIDGYQKRFVDKIHEKVDLERQLELMDEAFESVPETYLNAVRYLLLTDDTYAAKDDKVTYQYGVDYLEACVQLDKLIYQYAVLSGWPVPQRVEEITLVIYEDGSIEFG